MDSRSAAAAVRGRSQYPHAYAQHSEHMRAADAAQQFVRQHPIRPISTGPAALAAADSSSSLASLPSESFCCAGGAPNSRRAILLDAYASISALTVCLASWTSALDPPSWAGPRAT